MEETQNVLYAGGQKRISLLLAACLFAGAGLFFSTPAFSETKPTKNLSASPLFKILPDKDYNNTVTLSVRIPLEPGLHLYGPEVEKPFYATKLIIKDKGPIKWDISPLYPKSKNIDAMGQSIPILEADPKTNEVTITLKGQVVPKTPPGEYIIKVGLTYQRCSETQCLPPVIGKTYKTKYIVDKIQHTTNIGGGKLLKAIPTPIPAQGYGTSFSFFSYDIDLQKAGVWVPLVIAFMAGVILNIMPCVLPVIPIKILQITKQAHQEHHSPMRLSLVFGLGIVIFFLLIGIVAIILKSGFSWGQSFQSPTVLIGLCLVLIVLALGMFDIYQVTVPGFIANRDIVQKGYLGAFFMGFLAGILSTPCSFGVLGAAVAWAQIQVPMVTLLGFLMIGVGMACPYIVLSGFPGLLNKIPHAGRWTEIFKQCMGFILLGVVAFLVSALPKDRILSTLLYFVLFSFIIWFWGEVLEFRIGQWVKAGRGIVILAIILTGWALLGNKEKTLKWEKLDKDTYKEAIQKNKPVAIEFTADWCLNCRTVEYLVYHNKEVKEILNKKGIVLLKGDLTEENEYTTEALKSLSGQSGIPFTIVIRPGKENVLLPGIFKPSQLIDAVK